MPAARPLAESAHASYGRGAKARLASFLRAGPVNRVLRAVLRPVARWLPFSLVSRLPVVGRVEVRLPDGRALVLESDGRDPIAAAFYWHGDRAFEPETIALFVRLLPHTEVVFDVGASIGVFALAATAGAPHRVVYAFEPVPETGDRLERNRELNGVSRLTLVRGAASDRDGTAELNIPPGASLPVGASTLMGFRPTGRVISVPAVALDAFAAREGLARVDLIKVDTEGTEPGVLEGARRLLERDEPWIVCEVLKGMTEPRLQALLAPLGYRFFHITHAGLVEHDRIEGDPRYEDRNYLFATARRMSSAPEIFSPGPLT